ncbi:MAG: DUF1616 domain-containing protein [Thermofilum sp.]
MKEGKLWNLVQERARSRGLLNACLDLYKAWAEGELALEDPSPPLTLPEYLVRPDYSLWLWTLLSLATLTAVVVWVTENGFAPLLPLRYVLGSIAVLFLPGYSLVEALYPKAGDLEPLERLALSIGLSLALVPLVGLVLNYTPFGIRLWPVVASLEGLTVALALTAAYRKLVYLRLEARVIAGG